MRFPHSPGMGLDALNAEISKTVSANNSHHHSNNTYCLIGSILSTFYLSVHILYVRNRHPHFTDEGKQGPERFCEQFQNIISGLPEFTIQAFP